MASDQEQSYIERIQQIRLTEYPMMKDAVYLDHAGKPPAAKSLIERFSNDMLHNLYGNPHSNSSSSQLSTEAVERSRLAALQLFNADPAHFDLVFVANATAGAKLVVDCLRPNPAGFWYGYHKDSHTSLIGAREVATAGRRCFETDEEVQDWLLRNDRAPSSPSNGSSISPKQCSSDSYTGSAASSSPRASTFTSDSSSVSNDTDPENELREHPLELFSWPAQSNMSGRRLPLSWAKQARHAPAPRRYTLLDAAALVSTCPFDLSDPDAAPDFTVLSFYKMFGFPEIGALIVRKTCAHVLHKRSYFGGGTVDMVACLQEQWHISKTTSIHAALEDGTLPVHNITALHIALKVHEALYSSFAAIAQHTASLTQQLGLSLENLQHKNGQPVCKLYTALRDLSEQGPVVAFNVLDSGGSVISCTEVDRLASLHNIHMRSGGLCNPGGVAEALALAPRDLRRNLSAGHKCGAEHDVVDGRPTGVLRASLGAMSTTQDVCKLVTFVKTLFAEPDNRYTTHQDRNMNVQSTSTCSIEILQIFVYPIKSCGAFIVSPTSSWPVSRQGLEWDREWCIVHAGSQDILTQKRHPRMTLIEPTIDFDCGLLRVRLRQSRLGPVSGTGAGEHAFSVPLSQDPCSSDRTSSDHLVPVSSSNKRGLGIYDDKAISDLLSDHLSVPCHLARVCRSAGVGIRHAGTQHAGQLGDLTVPILSLSNESAMLAITQQSLTDLNEHIRQNYSQSCPTGPLAFRPNLVLSSSCSPYTEERWKSLMKNDLNDAGHEQHFKVLGPCRRCQVVCTDLGTGGRASNGEPLTTLTRYRKRAGGGAWFGVHLTLTDGSTKLRSGELLLAR